MSRRAAGGRVALLALPAALSGCLTITSSLRVDPRGGIARDVRVATESVEAAQEARRRLAPPWTVHDGADGKTVAARLQIAAGQPVPAGETGLVVAVRDRFFFTEVAYEEDWSRFRLGKGPPVIAPVPPARFHLPAWTRLLAHERNLAAIERRMRQSVKIEAEVELPGRIVDGNFHARQGNWLRWSFDLRSPAAPRARSRVYQPMRIAGAMSGAGLAGVLILAAIRRRTKARHGNGVVARKAPMSLP